MKIRRALIVDTDWTMVSESEDVRSLPAGALDSGLGSLLNRVQSTFPAGEGVLLLTASAAARLSIPATEPDDEQSAKFGPALESARAFGWRTDTLRGWTTLWREGAARVHLGILPWLDEGSFPLLGELPADTLNRVDRWHEFTGTAYHGTPGIAAAELMRNVVRGAGGKVPRWVPGNRWAVPEWDGCESPYHAGDWSRKHRAAHPAEIGPDANAAYLAAASTVEVATDPLVHTGKRSFDPKLAGLWLVKLGPWNLKTLPDPAGYGKVKGARWVTTPTLKLIHGLMKDGRHGGFDVLDSYTAPGFRALRRWAEIIRDGMAVEHPVREWDTDAPDVLAATFKAAYKASHGILKMGGPEGDRGSIRRPDWHYAWLAQARVTLWRKIYKAADAGHFPLRVDVDRVWYPSESADFATARAGIPEAFPLGVGLGKFKVREDDGFRVFREELIPA